MKRQDCLARIVQSRLGRSSRVNALEIELLEPYTKVVGDNVLHQKRKRQ
jgi:hypothetical protein